MTFILIEGGGKTLVLAPHPNVLRRRFRKMASARRVCVRLTRADGGVTRFGHGQVQQAYEEVC